jgi:hypothetical protein
VSVAASPRGPALTFARLRPTLGGEKPAFWSVATKAQRAHSDVGRVCGLEVRVSDPAFVYDLVYSLKRADYVATTLGPNTIFVRVPTATTREEARLHLGFYLANWRARHPGVDAELLER